MKLMVCSYKMDVLPCNKPLFKFEILYSVTQSWAGTKIDSMLNIIRDSTSSLDLPKYIYLPITVAIR